MAKLFSISKAICAHFRCIRHDLFPLKFTYSLVAVFNYYYYLPDELRVQFHQWNRRVLLIVCHTSLVSNSGRIYCSTITDYELSPFHLSKCKIHTKRQKWKLFEIPKCLLLRCCNILPALHSVSVHSANAHICFIACTLEFIVSNISNKHVLNINLGIQMK